MLNSRRGCGKRATLRAGLGVLLLGLALCDAAEAVMLDQIDDFQAPGTAGWGVGFSHPTPPIRVADGGPDGPGDAYLEAAANGSAGAGGRLAVFNTTQWSGDYIGEDVLSLGLDVIVLSGSDVSLRLGIQGPGGTFASAAPVIVTAGSGWQSVELSLDGPDLIALTPLPDLAATLSALSELRLIHADAAPVGGGTGAAAGEFIDTIAGFDNLIALPEPSQSVLLASGGATLVGLARRRQRFCTPTESASPARR
ncbi:MAG: hypothetical protein JRG92_13815 [Deltaproteobacteria bacterium]|nr:hypothetical protein [Deltaproteobacteria bacterium]MBW2384708.1 hypothetical protein [Deltaproteobacteria bacterium]MBW2697919.1 hypothetical protein [Deltaproteobacteria bacterium]